MNGKRIFMKVIRMFLIITLSILGINAAAIEVADSIGVETVSGTKFIKHQVVAGEGWYSIARKYGISYSELRMANKKDGDGLVIGQVVLVPAKAKINDPRFQKNYTDKKADEPKTDLKEKVAEKLNLEGKKKVHKVKNAETLFSIATTYSISVDELKKWNNLKDNTIEIGQELIVGVDEGLAKKELPVKDQKVEKENKKENVQPVNTESKVKVESPSTKVAEPMEKKETTNIVKTAIPEKIKTDDKKDEKKYSFANGRQEINEQGVASWIEDEDINPNKYYALHRTAPVGTIIKVTNRMNSTSVFVKVVGKLQETGDNEGLIIKISKASAERLNVLDKKFQADLIYGLSSN